MAACFAVGVAAGWWLHVSGGPRPAGDPRRSRGRLFGRRGISGYTSTQSRHVRLSTRLDGGPTGTAVIGASPRGAEPGGAIDVLRRRGLRLPIEGADVDALKGAFTERRTGEGGHTHEAVDLLAPRDTPVRAIEGGTIAKLFDSRAGGHTIYQFDPTERFAYYYAHLDRYADGCTTASAFRPAR